MDLDQKHHIKSDKLLVLIQKENQTRMHSVEGQPPAYDRNPDT